MKFLVLALCVCAASAASFGSFGTGAAQPFQYKPFAPTRAAAKATVQVFRPVSTPVVQAAKIIAPAPVAPVQVAPVPVAAVPAVKNYNHGSEAEAEIVRNESEVEPEGFRYYYETNNGIVGESTGSLRPVGDSQALVFTGSYKYYAPDGTPVVVEYVADENGYQPRGDVLPVGPEIPEAIVRSLQYIAQQKESESYKNVKQY